MPRQARIDAPGALHHIIVNGEFMEKQLQENFPPIVEDIENRLRNHEAPTSKKKSQVQLDLFS